VSWAGWAQPTISQLIISSLSLMLQREASMAQDETSQDEFAAAFWRPPVHGA
jgi:hypothetical protein